MSDLEHADAGRAGGAPKQASAGPAVLCRTALAIAGLVVSFTLAGPAAAAPVYIALGDSITFGETDLDYVPSLGDRGYVSRFADTLASRNGGVRPGVFNFAIDGETAASFQTATGRTPPVVSRTDPILAAQNLNYAGRETTPQAALFAQAVAQQTAAGNTVQTISITLGFNELAALASLPTQQALAAIPSTLAEYRANYSAVLTQIRTLAPTADLYLLNYFNPFPGDPTGANPATPIFAAGGPGLNDTIRDLAVQYGAFYVDTFTPFVGREAELTFIDEQPAGFVHAPPFGGVEPVGNVHPNDLGYDVIAAQAAAATVPTVVPEPSAMALLLTGLGALGMLRRRGVPARA